MGREEREEQRSRASGIQRRKGKQGHGAGRSTKKVYMNTP